MTVPLVLGTFKSETNGHPLLDALMDNSLPILLHVTMQAETHISMMELLELGTCKLAMSGHLLPDAQTDNNQLI